MSERDQLTVDAPDGIDEITVLKQRTKRIEDAAEMLWVVLANVSGGDWTKQTGEWQDTAARWRDNYFAAIK